MTIDNMNDTQSAVNCDANYSMIAPFRSMDPNFPDNPEPSKLLPLNDEQVELAQQRYGKNIIFLGDEKRWYMVLLFTRSTSYCLLSMATWVSGDRNGGLIMLIMVLISTVLRFWQEWKSASAAKSLKSMVSTTISVTRLYSCRHDCDQLQKA
ncbi:hypothetical protein BGZ76_006254 [Entomortierella beljakovae]|nr:hypothetical protein BGZ76_006254 [Entomortierella beljakovae]